MINCDSVCTVITSEDIASAIVAISSDSGVLCLAVKG